MSLSLDPHEYGTHPETGAPVLIRTNPYIRISSGRESPPLFLQAGQVYPGGEGAKAIPEKKWPDWLKDAIRDLSDQAAAEVGFKEIVQNLNAPSTPGKAA